MSDKKTKGRCEELKMCCKPTTGDGRDVFRLVISALRNLSPAGGGTTTQIHHHILNHQAVNMSYDDLKSAVRLALHKAAMLGFLRRRRTDCKYYIATMRTDQYKRKGSKCEEYQSSANVSAKDGWDALPAKKCKVGPPPSLVVAIKSHKGRIVPQKAKTAHRWVILPLGAKDFKPPPPPPPPTPSTPNSACFSASSLAILPNSSRCMLSPSQQALSISYCDDGEPDDADGVGH